MTDNEKRSLPDLQKLVGKYGNYRAIPPRAWAEYDADVKAYHADMIAGRADKWAPVVEPEPLALDPTIELMPINDIMAELREGQWISSRSKAEWNRRMQLWQRLDEHVRKKGWSSTSTNPTEGA